MDTENPLRFAPTEHSLRPSPVVGSALVPTILTFHIDPERAPNVLRKRRSLGGGLEGASNVEIDVAADGKVTISADQPMIAEEARRQVLLFASEPAVGCIYEGTVEELIEFFGAIVRITPRHVGLLHLSKIPVSDQGSWTGFLEEGQQVSVEVIGKSVVGQLQLSMLETGPDKASSV